MDNLIKDCQDRINDLQENCSRDKLDALFSLVWQLWKNTARNDLPSVADELYYLKDEMFIAEDYRCIIKDAKPEWYNELSEDVRQKVYNDVREMIDDDEFLAGANSSAIYRALDTISAEIDEGIRCYK